MIKPRDMLQWRNLITPLIVPLFISDRVDYIPSCGDIWSIQRYC
jgi:hypothetical protein